MIEFRNAQFYTHLHLPEPCGGELFFSNFVEFASEYIIRRGNRNIVVAMQELNKSGSHRPDG